MLSTLTSEDYVATQAWRSASLEICPVHGIGCRSLVRHGTYSRYTPFGPAKIVRCYCPRVPRTFSLLPDCFAAGLSGTLSDLEAAVEATETAPCLQAAARAVRPRPAVSLAANRRWLKRRQVLVLACLTSVDLHASGSSWRLRAIGCRARGSSRDCDAACRPARPSGRLAAAPAAAPWLPCCADDGSGESPPTHDGPCPSVVKASRKVPGQGDGGLSR